MVVVGESFEAYVSLGKSLSCNREAVCVRSHHAHYLVACLAQSCNSLQRASAGRDEVFYDNHLSASRQFALDEVLHAVVLSLRAHVDVREVEFVGNQCALSDSAGSYACHSLCLGEVLEDGVNEFELNVRAQPREREGLAVVAVERRFPT